MTQHLVHMLLFYQSQVCSMTSPLGNVKGFVSIAQKMTSQCQFKIITVAGAQWAIFHNVRQWGKNADFTALEVNKSEFSKLVHTKKPCVSTSLKRKLSLWLQGDDINRNQKLNDQPHHSINHMSPLKWPRDLTLKLCSKSHTFPFYL